MINPSVPGWIDKFFFEQDFSKKPFYESEELFYNKIRSTGFIFGHIIDLDVVSSIPIKNKLYEEVTKLGLLNTLFQMYRLIKKNNNHSVFIEEAVTYYSALSPKGFNPLKKMLDSSNPSNKLEKIIHDRVGTNEDLFSRNFSHVITNALLFIDVLAFMHFLKKKHISENYFTKIESIVIGVVSISLNKKTGISVHDDLLLKLFESSTRYNKLIDNKLNSIEEIDLSFLKNDLEKYYIIDLSGMSLWSDEKVENEERYFLFQLSNKLNISESFTLESITFVNKFINEYKNEIPYFNNSNPVKNFYDKITENVEVLIERNKNRLLKEMSESKELMFLLAKSTHKDLNKEERKKIKRQLLDICKTIPSLTIFLLPGGSLLLPILIKFIPKLLPSAFNENEERG